MAELCGLPMLLLFRMHESADGLELVSTHERQVAMWLVRQKLADFDKGKFRITKAGRAVLRE